MKRIVVLIFFCSLCSSLMAEDEMDIFTGKWMMIPYYAYEHYEESIFASVSLEHEEGAIIDFVSEDEALLIDEYSSENAYWELSETGEYEWTIYLFVEESEYSLELKYIHIDEYTLFFVMYDSEDPKYIVSGIMQPYPMM